MGPESLFSDRFILSALLCSIAILIAFGPELRHSFARIRANERAPQAEAPETESIG
jgi:hypothetical protein